jgi:ribosomal protein S18 acetylase RimI-like enzyme
MHVCIYTSFQEVPHEVRHRLSYPKQPNFFLSFDWFSLLFETSLHQTLLPRIYVLLDNQREPMGALFCAVARGGAGRRLLSLTNFYTLEYSPSLVQDRRDKNAIVSQLIAYIAAERPRWHLIRLTFMKAGVLEVRSALGRLRESGFSVGSFFQYENWYFTSSGETFQTYFSNRPSRLRNTITRKQKKLERTHNFRIKLIGHESSQLEEVVRDFIAVYNGSWKQPEPFPNFIPMLATICAKLRILRLGVLYVAGRPAAGQLWITAERKAIIYKLAYDEQYRELGVGSVLSREMFRVAIDEDHVDEIDYGVGSELYKKDWMASVREIYGVEAFNQKSLIGLLLSTMEAAKTTIKKARILLKRDDFSSSRFIGDQ